MNYCAGKSASKSRPKDVLGKNPFQGSYFSNSSASRYGKNNQLIIVEILL